MLSIAFVLGDASIYCVGWSRTVWTDIDVIFVLLKTQWDDIH